jgi:LacI family transcriptional regulator
MEVVAELGYETSLVAASLRRQQTNVIGILVAEFESFSAELLKGVSAAAVGTGYELLAYSGVVAGGSNAGWERRSLSRLAGTLVDGAIIVTPSALMPDSPIPIVAIDPHTGPGGPPTVDSDSAGGARVATQHLIDLGHRRIAHIRGRGGLASAQLREAGYRESLEAAGILFDPELVRDGEYQAALTTQGARELLTLPDRPTAVFAANDKSALGVMAVARELGLRVPEDVSIIGFDDIPEAASAAPPLTTMAQPLHDLGARALTMLIDLLHGDEVPGHVELPAEIVVRASTGPAPA